MQRDGEKLYLSIEEQVKTDLPSPLNLRTFDLHQVRLAVDTELDHLEELNSEDADQLTHQERLDIPRSLQEARERSEIVHEIGRETAWFSVEQQFVDS